MLSSASLDSEEALSASFTVDKTEAWRKVAFHSGPGNKWVTKQTPAPGSSCIQSPSPLLILKSFSK